MEQRPKGAPDWASAVSLAPRLAMPGIRDDHAELLRLGFKEGLRGVSRSVGESAKMHFEAYGILCLAEEAGDMQTCEALAGQVDFHSQFVALEAIVTELHAHAFLWLNHLDRSAAQTVDPFYLGQFGRHIVTDQSYGPLNVVGQFFLFFLRRG